MDLKNKKQNIKKKIQMSVFELTFESLKSEPNFQ